MSSRSRLALAAVTLALGACAGPSILLESRASSQESPLAFELRDWDWNGSSFELELRVTNHGDRTVFLERGFVALSDGERSMTPTARPQTSKVAPHGSRTVHLRYPAVDENVSALTLVFGTGALTFDEKAGEPLSMEPLRLIVGDGTANPATPGK